MKSVPLAAIRNYQLQIVGENTALVSQKLPKER